MITAALDDYSIFSFFLVSANARSSSDYRPGTALYGEGRKILWCTKCVLQHGRSNGGIWGYTDSMGIDGIAGHTPWELHFCVLFQASCCLEDTGGRSLASTSTTSSCSSTRLCGKNCLQSTHRNHYQACCVLACYSFFDSACVLTVQYSMEERVIFA